MMTLSKKVKEFRTSKRVSQLDLEVAIGASSGTISRIEAGKTNPTKETLMHIADALSLKPIETSYLLGTLSSNPTQSEIDSAKLTVSSMLNSYTSMSFLLDHHSRVIALSKGYETTLKYCGINIEKILGKHIMELIFDSKYGIRSFIDESDIDRISDITIAILKQEKKHLFNEPWWRELIGNLNTIPQFRTSWQHNTENNIDIYSEESRRVKVNVKGVVCEMTYAQIHLYSDPRFSVVEYVPRNRFLKLLLKNSFRTV